MIFCIDILYIFVLTFAIIYLIIIKVKGVVMAEKIVEFFGSLFGNDIITIFFVSAIPFVELRGSILIGIGGMALNDYLVWLLSWLGSTLVGVLLFFILKPILNLLKKIKWFKKFVDKIEEIILEKSAKISAKVDSEENKKTANKIKTLGVTGFISIPLPMTGTWTGTAIAVFLGMNFTQTILSVACGNLIASTIIFVLAKLFTAYIDIIIYALAGLILLVIISYIIKLSLKSKKENKAVEPDQKEQ